MPMPASNWMSSPGARNAIPGMEARYALTASACDARMGAGPGAALAIPEQRAGFDVMCGERADWPICIGEATHTKIRYTPISTISTRTVAAQGGANTRSSGGWHGIAEPARRGRHHGSCERREHASARRTRCHSGRVHPQGDSTPSCRYAYNSPSRYSPTGAHARSRSGTYCCGAGRRILRRIACSARRESPSSFRLVCKTSVAALTGRLLCSLHWQSGMQGHGGKSCGSRLTHCTAK